MTLRWKKFSTEDEEVSEASEAKGREEAVSSSETGGSGAFMAIGAGGGSAGAFGNRNGGGKSAPLVPTAVAAHPKAPLMLPCAGSSVIKAPTACGTWMATLSTVPWLVPSANPGKGHTGDEGDAAMTGYAVLAFLGGGYDHRTPNKYRATVKAVSTG